MSVSVIQEAERLFRTGHRQAAIALLEEHMRQSPADRKAAGVLGRIYVNQKQPQRAAYWLRLSLKIERQVASGQRSERVEGNALGSNVDLDDLDFITLEDVEVPEFNFNHRFGIDAAQETDQGQLPLRSNSIGPDHCDQPPLTAQEFKKANLYGQAEENDDIDDDDLAFIDNDTAEINPEYDESNNLDRNLASSFDEDILDSLGPNAEDEELVWEDFALEEGVEDNPDSEALEELPVRITDLQKARQIAAQIADEVGWLQQHLSILIEVLAYHRCHGKTQATLRELLIHSEVKPEELSVMHNLRFLWGGFGYNRRYRENLAYDGWPNISWQLALRLVRQLQASDAEEVLLFVEDCFQQWNDYPSLISAFPIFTLYLDYLIDHMESFKEINGQRMPPFVDYELFPDLEGQYAGWRMQKAKLPSGFHVVDGILTMRSWAKC